MLRPGIVLLDSETLGDVSFYQLTKLGNLTAYPSTSSEQRIERISGREIVITNKVVINKEVMDACPDLKLICIAATGMNNVDVEYARSKGIEVRNVSAYSTESVVQHAFAMLFYLMEHLPYYDDYVKSGKYSGSTIFTHHGKPFNELAGKKYGIIGMGTIGKRVAQVALAFGAEVIYYSTSGKNLDTGYRHVPLHDLLTRSDIVSIHCPLSDSTRDLIGYEEFCLMKNNAILINVARGGIVNETDLAAALDEDLIAGAGLDVLKSEPPESSNPLFRIKNKERLLITPHMAWAGVESRYRLIQGIIGNITDFVSRQS